MAAFVRKRDSHRARTQIEWGEVVIKLFAFKDDGVECRIIIWRLIYDHRHRSSLVDCWTGRRRGRGDCFACCELIFWDEPVDT